MSKNKIHLVGSIPLESSEAVFDLVGKYLMNSCNRVPDGETGDRLNWIGWQHNIFVKQEALVQCKDKEREYQLYPPYTFAEGRGPDEIKFENLGFAQQAILSYELFQKKQRAGILSPEAKFLVAIPTPFAPVYSFVSYEVQELIFPSYERAILNEITCIFEKINPDKVAIQWDVATEMSIFEKVYTATFENEWDILIARLAKLGDAIPIEAELGFHLCYGSMNNKHWKEPDDLTICMLVLNKLTNQLVREIDFVHVPVPINRKDDDYYKPLETWELKSRQDFFLGLIHEEDGLEGNLARIKTASRYLPRFGLSTECGMGRRDPRVIPKWMKLMSELVIKI